MQAKVGKEPSELDITDLDAPTIVAFLDHLEQERRNGIRTRNARLSAIRSFFRFAALRHPEHAAVIARVLDIPAKRCEMKEVDYLDRDEIRRHAERRFSADRMVADYATLYKDLVEGRS